MKAEIIAVGTEMLMGQIVDTNSPFMARQLNELGIDHYVETIIGDNPERLIAVTKQAEERSDVIIYSGGIGPTRDDLTKQTIAQHLDEELIYDEAGLNKIKAYFFKRNIEMSQNNYRMALTFKNGISFVNLTGQAVGSAVEKNGKIYIFLPGFPNELETMFINGVKPYLAKFIAQKEVITSRYLNYFGIGESKLAKEIDDLIVHQKNPTIAPYASKLFVTLRITAKGSNQEENDQALDKIEKTINDRVGQYFYGEGFNFTPIHALCDRLMSINQTLSFAESLTGGLAASSVVAIEGVSAIFKGSIVAYDKQTKANVLGVSEETLKTKGMVSSECACEMAEEALRKFKSDNAMSFTGVAGPSKMEGQDVGTVFVGYAQKNKTTKVLRYQLAGNREIIRERIVYQACIDMINLLK